MRDEVPKLEADFEKFFLGNVAKLYQVLKSPLYTVPEHVDVLIGLHRVGRLFN